MCYPLGFLALVKCTRLYGVTFYRWAAQAEKANAGWARCCADSRVFVVPLLTRHYDQQELPRELATRGSPEFTQLTSPWRIVSAAGDVGGSSARS